MANRQARDPGSFREVTGTAQLSGIPSIAVETGQAARALQQVAGQLSSRLGQMADEAAAREATVAALADMQQDPGAASYQQARAVETAAASRAQVNASPDVRNAISAAAQKYGVDPAALMRIAELESSLNPKAKNPNSSAGGLFQFIDGTAKAYGLADRFDPVQASDAAARLARDNATSLRKVLGREPTVGELYLAHQQGAGGAAKLLGNRGADAASLVGADAVRLNGGRAGMTAGEFADLWVAKAEGRTGRAGPGAPAAPPRLPPLALRRDGTIYGEAYDRAAMSAYGWRLDADVSTRLTAIFDEHQNNPAAFAGEVQKLQQEYLTSEDMRDPQVREAFARNFAARSQGYALKVAALQQQRVQAEQRVAVEDGLSARALELEKKAYGLGAAPEADKLLSDELAQLNVSIDAAVSSNALTPEEGAKRKKDLAGTATRSRVQGVFDALDGPAAQEQFALGLLADWKDGKGPVAKMPYDEVKALSQTLFRDARSRANENAASARAEKARIKALTNDDVSSIEATGKPLDLAASGTDIATVQSALTPAEYEQWQMAREEAGLTFEAVSGMETLPASQLQMRVAGLVPQPGTVGYATQERVLSKAERKAEGILKLRSSDPAFAVEQAFPQVAALREAADLQDPQAMQDLIAARLQAQDALDIPEYARQPLTRAEVEVLSGPVSGVGDRVQQVRAMQQLVKDVQMQYGPHADDVVRQIIQARGIDRELAAYGAQLMTRMGTGSRPTVSDARRGAVLTETSAADSALLPKPSSDQIVAARLGAAAGAGNPPPPPQPPYRAIQMLISQPGLAADFDRKYGPGSAARILADRRPDPSMRRVEGGVEFVDETGEGFIPDGEVINGR